jgi:hypothetical protein
MTTEVDALIDHYLRELEAQLGDLPAGRRQELLDEVSAHIADARAALDPETDAGVRTLLERLGDPAEIAAEARERFGVRPQPPSPATPRLEVVAIVLLVIPFLGWVVGVVLVWMSRLWTTRDKLIGTLGGLAWLWAGLGTIALRRPSAPATPVGAEGPGGLPATGPTGSTLLELVLFVVPFLLPILAAVYLGFRLRRSTDS